MQNKKARLPGDVNYDIQLNALVRTNISVWYNKGRRKRVALAGLQQIKTYRP